MSKRTTESTKPILRTYVAISLSELKTKLKKKGSKKISVLYETKNQTFEKVDLKKNEIPLDLKSQYTFWQHKTKNELDDKKQSLQCVLPEEFTWKDWQLLIPKCDLCKTVLKNVSKFENYKCVNLQGHWYGYGFETKKTRSKKKKMTEVINLAFEDARLLINVPESKLFEFTTLRFLELNSNKNINQIHLQEMRECLELFHHEPDIPLKIIYLLKRFKGGDDNKDNDDCLLSLKINNVPDDYGFSITNDFLIPWQNITPFMLFLRKALFFEIKKDLSRESKNKFDILKTSIETGKTYTNKIINIVYDIDTIFGVSQKNIKTKSKLNVNLSKNNIPSNISQRWYNDNMLFSVGWIIWKFPKDFIDSSQIKPGEILFFSPLEITMIMKSVSHSTESYHIDKVTKHLSGFCTRLFQYLETDTDRDLLQIKKVIAFLNLNENHWCLILSDLVTNQNYNIDGLNNSIGSHNKLQTIQYFLIRIADLINNYITKGKIFLYSSRNDKTNIKNLLRKGITTLFTELFGERKERKKDVMSMSMSMSMLPSREMNAISQIIIKKQEDESNCGPIVCFYAILTLLPLTWWTEKRRDQRKYFSRYLYHSQFYESFRIYLADKILERTQQYERPKIQ